MWHLWIPRVFALVLAVSGCCLLPATAFPIFWLGFLLWIGWILISVGVAWLNNPLFWLCCALWDSYWLFMLLHETNLNVSELYYWHARLHPAASAILSITAATIQIIYYARMEGPQSIDRE
ncbi:MAG: hypothetical protein L0228_12625 [Planctomycetes bacterium]|nr:hypothetical protein [Planctomycetota bacterium]